MGRALAPVLRHALRHVGGIMRRGPHPPNRAPSAPPPTRHLSTAVGAAPAPSGSGGLLLRGGLAMLGAAAAGVGGAAYTDEGFYRTILFWMHAFPPYAHYRAVEWWVKGRSDEEQTAAYADMHRKYAPEALRVILMLRGFYVKIGQIGSTRGDFLPQEYLDNLATLQDGVPPEPAEYVRGVVERELGRPFGEVFAWLADAPIGAATIGQVHEARLADGREVVVKVQYPSVERLFDSDISTIESFCALAQPEFLPILEEIRRQFMTEFDYRREGRHLAAVGDNLRRFRGQVVVPRPVEELTTRKVLVMERVPGGKLVDGVMEAYRQVAAARGMTLEELKRDFVAKGGATREAGAPAPSAAYIAAARAAIVVADGAVNAATLARNAARGLRGRPPLPYRATPLPLNSPRLVDTLLRVHAHEIFEDGLFNGDPHPGNILLMPDGRLGLIDYGQVKQLTLEQRLRLAELVVALAEGDEQAVVGAYTRMGFRTQKMRPDVIHSHATIGFDRDDREVTGGRNIQQFFEHLNDVDKTEAVPDFVVMPGRVAVLMRGLATLLQLPPLRVAEAWAPACRRLLRRHPREAALVREAHYPAMEVTG